MSRCLLIRIFVPEQTKICWFSRNNVKTCHQDAPSWCSAQGPCLWDFHLEGHIPSNMNTLIISLLFLNLYGVLTDANALLNIDVWVSCIFKPYCIFKPDISVGSTIMCSWKIWTCYSIKYWVKKSNTLIKLCSSTTHKLLYLLNYWYKKLGTVSVLRRIFQTCFTFLLLFINNFISIIIHRLFKMIVYYSYLAN